MSFTIDNWGDTTQHDCDRANEALDYVIAYLCDGKETDDKREQLIKHAHDLVGNYYHPDLTVAEIVQWATSK